MVLDIRDVQCMPPLSDADVLHEHVTLSLINYCINRTFPKQPALLEPGSSKEKDSRLTATVESREDSPRRVGHDPCQRSHRYISINVPDDVHYLRQLSPSVGDDFGD